MGQFIEYKGYQAKIEYSEEDETFIGQVLGIHDTLLFEGVTVRELTEMFHNSIDDYVAMCAGIGKIPEKEYKGAFYVHLSPELHKQVALVAEKHNLNAQSVYE